MNQKTQTNLLFGIGAITAAVVAGYFGLDYLSGKKAPAPATAASTGDYSAAIAAATANISTPGEVLTGDEAKRIGEEVARQVASQVAQAIVDQKISGGTAAAGGGLTEADARRIGEEEGRRVAQEVAAAAVQQAMGSGGMTEADARRIGEEEGRKVAQEVAAATIQQALAASGGGGRSSGLTAAEAEQIGIAAGRRAARQVAANAARDVVRNEFGGSVVAKSDGGSSATTQAAPTETASAEPAASSNSNSKPAPSQRSGAGADALHAWWTAPASGDFGLVYAGQPKGESAIALLFSGKPGDTALNQSVKVYDAKGALVSGSWEAAANPRLAVLRGLQPGRYTVVVEPALADASGKAVNKGQHGPVYVI